MIVSDKYKYVFIGLPFSASSAISKDLCDKYEGKPYLRKHSLYSDFKKQTNKSKLKYRVFAVLRNPMEITITSYEKLKSNPNNIYTNSILFKENGGHISKKQRKKYNFIKKNQATFQEFFLEFYKYPYDNLASLTIDDCDFIIRYDKLQEDYLKVLKKIGVKNPTELPVKNKSKTKLSDITSYFNSEIRERSVSVFGPFMMKYNFKFPKNYGETKVHKKYIIKFKVLGFLRKLFYKFRKQTINKSSKETIYGNLQKEDKA